MSAFCQQLKTQVVSRPEIHYRLASFQAPGASTTIAYGVNNLGDIVGFSDAGDAGFLYSGGEFQTIACPDVPFTTASGINDEGVIVGYCGDQEVQGFILENGAYRYLMYPDSISTYLFGINNRGAIVGQYVTEKAPHFHAFVYSDGAYTQIRNTSSGAAINSTGTVAADNCSKYDCFGELYGKRKKHWKRLEQVIYPGAAATFLNGINDNGDLVGFWAAPNDSAYEGFVYFANTGQFAKVNVKRSENTELFGISNSDEIVGCYRAGNEVFGIYGQPSP